MRELPTAFCAEVMYRMARMEKVSPEMLQLIERALSSDAEAGRTAFMEYCTQCHPGGEAGLGPSLNDKALPTFLKKFQVRQGIGSMPSFSEAEISDQQLDDIMAYLKALRDHEGEPGG